MKPEEQRIAIAEACGLKPVSFPSNITPMHCRTGASGAWFTPSAAKYMRRTFSGCATPKVIPDYLNDLNAMHEAEKALGDKLLYYYQNLHDICNRSDIYTTIATATQRAEAFLKTIGKWVES